MQILVTGASGYIGCELSHVLAQQGHTVHALVRSMKAAAILQHPNIKILRGDITDPASIAAAMAGCQQVYHTAGLVQIAAYDPGKFYRSNVSGTRHILDAALAHGIEKIVFTSSCGVWGFTGEEIFTEKNGRIAPNDNDYELSKIMAEKLALSYVNKGLKVVIVNPSKVFGYGKHQHPCKVNYNAYINSWVDKKWILAPWNLRVMSNLVFIRDVVNGHLLAMQKGRAGDRYILGGENLSLQQIVYTIRVLSGKKKFLLRIPTPVIFLWSIVELVKSKLSKRDPVIVPAAVSRLSKHAKYSSQLAIDRLGYRITPFKEAMKQTMIDAKKFQTER